MDLALLVYGISILSKLSMVLGLLTGLGAIVLAISSLVRVFHTRESWDSQREDQIKQDRRDASVKVMKYSSIVVGVAVLLNVLLPSEKTAYTMVGAYAAQKVAENDKVQQLSGKVLTIIEQKLDTYIQEGIAQVDKKVSK